MPPPVRPGLETVLVVEGHDDVGDAADDEQGRQLLNRGCRNDWKEIADAVARVGAVRRAAVVSVGFPGPENSSPCAVVCSRLSWNTCAPQEKLDPSVGMNWCVQVDA